MKIQLKIAFVISMLIIIFFNKHIYDSRLKSFDVKEKLNKYLFIKIASSFSNEWEINELDELSDYIYEIGVIKYRLTMYEIIILVKCESDFNQYVRSDKGAIGLFQVMPETAKIVCNNLGIEYSYRRLKKDEKYNALIGLTHYRAIKKRYRGYKSSIVSYNCGEIKDWKYYWEYIKYINRNQKKVDKVILDVIKKI